MTPEQAIRNSKVMMAWANGSSIQVQHIGADTDEWWDLDDDSAPVWNFMTYNYRVKPAPVDEHLYIAVTKRGSTTNYAVILDYTAARAYPCDEVLELQIINRYEGAGV